MALCQGAALHYLDSSTGINDFDVYTFYRQHPHKHWRARRIKSYDFGRAKFGQSLDKPDFVGMRVDCLGRSIAADIGEDPIEVSAHRPQRDGAPFGAQGGDFAGTHLWPGGVAIVARRMMYGTAGRCNGVTALPHAQ